MKTLFFAFPGNEYLTNKICSMAGGEMGEWILRNFPDQETYVRITSDVAGKNCVIVCSLQQPDSKIIPLYFLIKLCRDLKATKIILVAPYLAYMRLDTLFHPGEAVSSEYFAQLVSTWANALLTIDPHLHRKHNMAELYSIPCTVVHAAPLIAAWIHRHIEKPVLIGPDIESSQWVSQTSKLANAPYMVLRKNRLTDDKVEVSVPDTEAYKGYTPVLVDDIISTAKTMIETVKHLKAAGMLPPVVIGVHPIFVGNAYKQLMQAGAGRIVSCNTIPHPSNKIDVSGLLADGLAKLL